MSKPQTKRKAQLKLARLEIVAKLYKRGHSVREIQAEVKKRLDIATYSLATVHTDIHSLLDEWRDSRIDDMDAALQLELERIDDTVKELWSQWEKSKEDHVKTSKMRRRVPSKKEDAKKETLKTSRLEDHETNVVGLGNPAYIAEIRQQLAERRKLLGLYAPEKKDISGSLSFADYLIESGLIDEAEQQTAQ